jgi:hypothetical protein
MCARPAIMAAGEVWRRSSTFLLALVVLVLLGGCATSHVPTRLAGGYGRRSLVPPLYADSRRVWRASDAALTEVPGSAGGIFGRELDAFQKVQEACGLEEEVWHPAGAALYMEQARQLLGRLAKTSVTQKSFGPRLALSWLLREALAGGERVEYAELKRRTERFWPLVLVRPDGYLVTALGGNPIQRMGPVVLKEGVLRAGNLVVGAFYFSLGGVLYPVDDSLRRVATIPWAELGLERDWLNAALDGAQDAVGEMALALEQSVLHPIRSAEDLAQLPTTVALLIASSPEYFARYGAMSMQDQIREAARLATHLLMMFGSSAGTVGRVGALGSELPVLAVSADGVLAVRTVAVSAGTATTTLEVGAGSLSVLHMANQGPGESEAEATSNARPPHRTEPRLDDGNEQEGWRHIESRHITGTHPNGPGALFAPGTSREQLLEAARDIVKNGTRISNPGRRIQTFQMKVKINGQKNLVRVVVDADDANRVITMFPVEGG